MDERQTQTAVAVPVGPDVAAARTFLDALVRQDYVGLHGALAPHVRLRALLPGGLREWTGATAAADRFARWFGDTQHHELLEQAADEVVGRIHLRWRLRLQAERLGAGRFVVEQQAYADTDEHGRISGLDLLCSGYVRERSDG